jgi:predicted transcriptional regulator
LIKHGEKNRTFMITDKGMYYLEMYNNLPEFVGIAR